MKNMRRAELSRALALCLLSVVACSDDDSTTSSAGAVGKGDARAEEDSDAGADAEAEEGTEAGVHGDVVEGAPIRVSESEVGAIASAANRAEIAQARAALPRLGDRRAKEFAQHMVDAHSAAEQRQAELLRKKGITTSDNPVSALIQKESDGVVAQLTSAPEGSVDLLYADAQVTAHTKVLGLLDEVMIPSTTDRDLLSELEAAREEVESHLDDAKALKRDLTSK